MAAKELGPWDPLRPEDAEFATWAAPWWVAGGWALDLVLGRQTREHWDFDLLVLRRDRHLYGRSFSTGMSTPPTHPGSLRPWPVAETLPPAVHDIWCRRTPTSPWAFQLMIDDTVGDDWLFRRNHSVRRPVQSLAGRASTATMAVLSPEVQVLYKSRGLRDKDVADFQAMRPHLSPDECNWLRTALNIVAPEHPWIRDL
jgi:Aminoglycoside-2''-adenylyltransferase